MGRERSAPDDAATAGGALVYVVPSRAGLVWPWSTHPAWSDPLDNRLVASMLLTVGLGALFALWRNDRGVARLLVLIVWAYWVVVGAALILHAAAEPAFLLPDAVYV
jgi:ABC-type sugar transport system permease subunit